MTGKAFSRWRQTAVEQVRFSPDRKAIAAELTDHYEDHVAALLEAGYQRQEAEDRALKAMGDAKEVGSALNQVHRYWLGVLWKASQLLLAVLALAAAVQGVSLLRQQGRIPAWERTAEQLAYEEPPAWAERCRIPGGTVYLAPGERTEIQENGYTAYHADIWLELDRPISDRGFLSLELRDQEGLIPRTVRDSDLEEPHLRRGSVQTRGARAPGWTRQRYEVRLYLARQPEFLELTQPYGEAPWSVRCEWEARI